MRGNLLMAGIIIAIMSVGIIHAEGNPLPIVVKLIPDSTTFGNYDVSVTNMRTGETLSGKTNEYYEFVIDWANLLNGYNKGDKFSIKVLGQIKEITFVGTPPIEFKDSLGNPADINVFVVSELCPSQCIKTVSVGSGSGCNKCPNCPSISCPNCPSNYCPNCPECKPTTCVDTICPNAPVCPTCKTCEVTECPVCNAGLFDNIMGLILALVTGAGIGFVVRRNKDGKIAVQVTQHKHFGAESYHSINTIHLKNPHTKGDVVPKYSADGKYIPSGE